MTSVKIYTQLVILGIKHPRMWVPSTQFQKLSKNFKIEFPGNWTKILISPESEWFTESVPNFWNRSWKKVLSISHPGIQPTHKYRYIARKTPIPTRYCILKNCHNCARSFNHNFGTRASRAVCTAMYHQAGCCDFYIKRSKGILFWV